jgi:NitT/TauT family transport system substrate-binding protein
LQRTGVSAGALAAGAAFGLPARPAFAGTEARPQLKLGWAGGTCEAATYVGHDVGFFADEGLDVELVRLANSQAGIDALGAGKIDAIGGVIYQYLKPFEQGLDVRFAAGLHGGCLRLVAKPNCGVHKLADLKGRTVGVDAIGGGSMAFVSALLTREGVDPSVSRTRESRCCIGDDGRPIGAALLEGASNRRMRLTSKDLGRERSGQKARVTRQVRTEEMNVSEPSS